MTVHAIEEMAEDGLDILDFNQNLFPGSHLNSSGLNIPPSADLAQGFC
jgi:hypothetical protein